MKIIQCECGEIFEKLQWNHRYCSKCKYEKQKERDRENKRKKSTSPAYKEYHKQYRLKNKIKKTYQDDKEHYLNIPEEKIKRYVVDEFGRIIGYELYSFE